MSKKRHIKIWYHGADNIGPMFTYTCEMCGHSIASDKYCYCPWCGTSFSSEGLESIEFRKGYNAAKQDMIRLLQKEV